MAGTWRVRYGLNNATRMAEVLDMVSEYEDEYREIVGAAAADSEGD